MSGTPASLDKIKSLEVLYDNPMAVYYPGQHLQGTVIVRLNQPLSVRGIRVHFSGFANVHWSAENVNGKTGLQHYSAHETYFDSVDWVFGKEEGSEELAAGRHAYKFQFPLPSDLPSSFESEIGQVRYFCKAIIDIPKWFDHTAKRPFTIVNLLDLNTKPETLRGDQASKEVTIQSCCCCISGPIRASLHLQRTGYVPGEAIPCYGEVENLSRRKMTKSVMELAQLVCYRANNKTNTLLVPVTAIERPAIRAGGQDQWNGVKLLIPAVPPSFLEGCGIIRISYHLNLKVVPSFGHDFTASVEVVIGGIPHEQIVQENPPLPFTPQLSTSIDQFSGPGRAAFSNMPPPQPPSMPFNIPPPGYSESVFGKQNVGDKDDKHDIGGYNQFAPVYTYYNWNTEVVTTFLGLPMSVEVQ